MCEAAGAGEPEAKRGRGEHDDDRHEHSRYSVRKSLNRRFAGLCRLYQAGHVSKRGVGTDAGCANHQSPVGCDGGTRDGAVDGHFDGDTLAGDKAHVDRRRSLLDDAVGGDAFAWAHDEPVADTKGARRASLLATVRLQHVGVVGPQCQQCAQRAARAPLRAGLEPTPGKDECDGGTGDLEVQVMTVAALGDQRHRHRHSDVAGGCGQQRVQAPAVRSRDAN